MGLNLADGSKFLAVSALVVAFPPIFTKVGKEEALKLSLSLLLLYLLRGFGQFLMDASLTFGRSDRRKPFSQATLAFIKKTGNIFIFSEIPSILAAAYLGLKYLPNWIIPPYEKGLIYACPVIILVEGFAAMTVILSSGQLWSESILESSNFVKGVIACGCGAGVLAASLVIVKLYLSGTISTVLSATLVAVFVTLIIILSIATILTEHGTITDSTLLFIYTTYNLWLISKNTTPIALRTTTSNPFSSLADMVGRTLNFTGWNSIHGMVKATLNIFSIEIVATILFQMALFVIAARLYERARIINGGEEVDDSKEIETGSWFIGIIWPCFGRSILVAVYTYSWLIHTMSAKPSAYLDPVTWRWINIFGCLLIYTIHLLQPPNDDEHHHLHND